MKKTGQIKRLKNGNWQIRVQWRNTNGARQSVSKSGYRTRDAAQTALDKVLAARRAAKRAPKREYKNFNDLFDAYLEIVKPTVREQTFFLYERLIDGYLRPEFGEKNVAALTTLEIEKYYVRLQDKFTGEFIVKIHNQLGGALKKAKAWKWINENPMREAAPPSRKTKPKNPVRRIVPKDTLQPAEMFRLFDHCPTVSLRAQWMFFALTGARASEVFAARWRDADLTRGVFFVRQVLVQQKRVKKFDAPKTEKSVRRIPLPAAFVPILKAHKIAQNVARLRAGEKWVDNDLIFPTGFGKPQRLSNIGEKLARLCADAGIVKHITPHSFRHTFATLARQSGEDLKVISEYLGHASIRITADIYSHVDFDEKRKISDRMAGLILKTRA